MSFPRFLAALPVVLLVGCGGPPPPRHDVVQELIAEEPVIAGIELSEGWWDDFGDETLGAVVEETLRANYDLRVAAANVDAALAQSRIDGADLWPQVQAGGSAQRSKQIFLGLPIPGEIPATYTTQYRSGLSTSWELDLWGRVRNARSAAAANVQASAADWHGARLSLAAQSAKAYLALREAELQTTLARDTRAAFAGTAETAWDRYSRGLLSPLDVHLTRASAATADALLAQREEQLAAAQRRLQVLLGRNPVHHSTPEIMGGELPAMPREVPGWLPSELVFRRPDLAAAERRFAGSEAGVRTAKAARYPRFALTGSAGTISTELGNLVDGDFSIWSVAGNIVAPLFQGGRLQAQVELAESRRDASWAQYAQAVLDAYAEVESALTREQTLARREEALARAAADARAAWTLAEERYANGLGDLLSVLESQRRSLQADGELLTVRRLRLDARVDLYVALGGGFQDAQVQHARHDERSEEVEQ